MKIETSLAPALNELAWASAMVELNTWRGRWLQSFAGIESAVTDTLLLLRDVPTRGEEVKLRHLCGQRIEDLLTLVSDGGAFAKEGPQVVKAIHAFRTHEVLRNMLAHGHAKVALERGGEWLAVLRMTAIRGQEPHKVEMVVEQAHSQTLLRDLHRTGQSLSAHLRNLCAAVGDQSIAT